MKWKTVESGNKVEVWIETGPSKPPRLWGVTTSPREIGFSTERGNEAYGIDRGVFERYSESVIAPAIEGRPWDCNCVLSILESYLLEPEKHAALLALLVERIHLADGVSCIDSRLSRLVTRFIGKLANLQDGIGQLLVSAWCYNLLNALFVKAGNMAGLRSWVIGQRVLFDKTFMDGLPVVARLQPRVADYCDMLLNLVNQARQCV